MGTFLLSRQGDIFIESRHRQSHILTLFPCSGILQRMARKLRIEYPGSIYHPPVREAPARQA